MDELNSFEFSEFSIYEILYMGHEALTYLVECTIDPATRDPFDVVADIEADLKHPLAFILGEPNM